MFWLGKFLGAIFGFLVAGPIGAIVGILLGNYFDVSRSGHWQSSNYSHTHAQDVFFRATFTVMGYIAKSDGRVSEDEIRVARHIMQSMFLNSDMRRQAIEFFTKGKRSDFNLESELNELKQACFHQVNLLQLFIEIQLQAAFAEGRLSLEKQRILEKICLYLGFEPGNFFYTQRAGYDYSHYQKNNSYYHQTASESQLTMAYRLLGVNATVSDADLKKAYRKLMSQNHPDKLVSKGLPEEMLKLATQKTQEIKSAYELICKNRGI